MNKKIIFIFILTIAALGVLWAYSFGPLAGIRTARVNSVSLQSTPQQTVIAQESIAFNIYHNKDLTENFYTIKFPQPWQMQSANQAGSYHLTFAIGSSSAELMDVPDNSTLELFVLSQEEPRLKKTIPEYTRLDYQKLSINGDDAYQLTYGSGVNGTPYKTVKTYIAGQDHAAVVTLSAAQDSFSDLQSIFTSVLNSFQWENK